MGDADWEEEEETEGPDMGDVDFRYLGEIFLES
jgi:hypothetical protein